MTELFLEMVNRSYSAMWIVLAVVVLRLFLRKAPRWLHGALWALVAVRLVLPFSVESPLSIQPSAQVISPAIMQGQTPSVHTGLAFMNSAINPVLAQSEVRPVVGWLSALAVVWMAGAVLMVGYLAFSCLRLRKQMEGAALIRENILQGEAVPTPFVFGLFRPRIYLPADLDPADTAFVVAHEQAHIRRKDHWWKPLGFLLLAVHWFNPALWAAYLLLCRDLELACDEAVIRKLNAADRADYSEALLRCSVEAPLLTACPLAFGEVGVKTRVRHVLSYKKPAFWLLILALLAGIAVAVFLWTDPVEPSAVETWVDYLNAPMKMDYDKTLETTVHGVPLQYTPMSITRTDTGEEILFGMPIWNVFFADLNGDSCPEVCATVSYGSGIIDNHVMVADLQTGEQYVLWERGEYDYQLRLERNMLICEKRVYPNGELVQKGPLGMGSGSFRMWNLAIGDPVMRPTDCGLTGVFDNYLYLEREGQTYRYEQTWIDGESITRGELLDTFVEIAQPENVTWKIYAIKDTDDSQVLAVVDDYHLFRYVYSPPKAADEAELERLKQEEVVILEDGEPTHGQKLWEDFYETVSKGEPAVIRMASWYTLEEERCDDRYYAAYKEDYPALYVHDLTYDGETFVLEWEENGQRLVRKYEYLMRYERTIPSAASFQEAKIKIEYTLTHDNTLTWDDIWQGMISSQSGAYIDHFTIYQEYPRAPY